MWSIWTNTSYIVTAQTNQNMKLSLVTLKDVSTRSWPQVSSPCFMSWASPVLPRWASLMTQKEKWLQLLLSDSSECKSSSPRFSELKSRSLNGVHSDHSSFDATNLVRLVSLTAVCWHAALSVIPSGATTNTYVASKWSSPVENNNNSINFSNTECN